MNILIEYYKKIEKLTAGWDYNQPIFHPLREVNEIAKKAIANPEWTMDNGGDDLCPSVQIKMILNRSCFLTDHGTFKKVSYIINNLHLITAISEGQLKVEDLQGVDWKDHPDYVDAYFETGYLTSITEYGGKKIETTRELTEDEMEFLDDECSDWLYDQKERALY